MGIKTERVAHKLQLEIAIEELIEMDRVEMGLGDALCPAVEILTCLVILFNSPKTSEPYSLLSCETMDETQGFNIVRKGKQLAEDV